MNDIAEMARSRTQCIDDVAYAIACVMVRNTLLGMLGDIVIEPAKREIQVHKLACQMALDIRAEAIAAIEAYEAVP